QVWLSVLSQGRRDADDKRIDFTHAPHVGRGLKPMLDCLPNQLGADVLYVASGSIETCHLLLIDVKTDDLVSHFGESQHQRQANVTETQDADDGLATLYPLKECVAGSCPTRGVTH